MMTSRLAILLAALLASYVDGQSDVQNLVVVTQEPEVGAEALSEVAETEAAPDAATGLRGASKKNAEIAQAESQALEAIASEQYVTAETEMAKYFDAQEKKMAKMRSESHTLADEHEQQAEENP
jgi:hypothetical protein